MLISQAIKFRRRNICSIYIWKQTNIVSQYKSWSSDRLKMRCQRRRFVR